MSSDSAATSRQHARTGPSLPQTPEPSHAEQVRTLISQVKTATLSTLSRKHPTFPFGSLMPYALDGKGRAIFLISNMAMHTQNLKADPHASLFVAQSADGSDPLGVARATLVGVASPIPASEVPAAREIYIARHENSRYWVDFQDFSFFWLEAIDVYYVGGFGVMGWVPADDYKVASPDPLAEAAPAILAHMNGDHVDSMILLAQANVGITATEASMTSVDRLGFSLRLKTADGMKGARINFPEEVRDPKETRGALVEMVRRARLTA